MLSLSLLIFLSDRQWQCLFRVTCEFDAVNRSCCDTSSPSRVSLVDELELGIRPMRLPMMLLAFVFSLKFRLYCFLFQSNSCQAARPGAERSHEEHRNVEQSYGQSDFVFIANELNQLA